jgi:hypothetical protein
LPGQQIKIIGGRLAYFQSARSNTNPAKPTLKRLTDEILSREKQKLQSQFSHQAAANRHPKGHAVGHCLLAKRSIV